MLIGLNLKNFEATNRNILFLLAIFYFGSVFGIRHLDSDSVLHILNYWGWGGPVILSHHSMRTVSDSRLYSDDQDSHCSVRK